MPNYTVRLSSDLTNNSSGTVSDTVEAAYVQPGETWVEFKDANNKLVALYAQNTVLSIRNDEAVNAPTTVVNVSANVGNDGEPAKSISKTIENAKKRGSLA